MVVLFGGSVVLDARVSGMVGLVREVEGFQTRLHPFYENQNDWKMVRIGRGIEAKSQTSQNRSNGDSSPRCKMYREFRIARKVVLQVNVIVRVVAFDWWA